MSTIFACFNPTDPVPAETMEKMLAASDYWQPDGTSTEASHDGHCRMARAALFNTPQSKREAVVRDEAGNMISANARIDNRHELTKALNIAAADLGRMPDSALILAAWRRWGEACPQHLLGDFAFIIWDEANHRLFCARDHFGVKVLFYAHGAHGVMLTNEHHALFSANHLNRQIKEHWLIRHLWGQGAEAVASPYHGIALLPPAHSMRIDCDGTINLCRYWDLEDSNQWKDWDDERLIEALRSRFQHAVKVRLESDYPLAAELSEGLDSNGIVGFAAKMLGNEPLHTLSYSCEALTDENRQVWEKTYEDIFGMLAMHDNLKPVWSGKQDEAEHETQLQAFHHHTGFLGINGGHFLRSRLASEKGARVMLSGWGGDHCVSTYGDFYESELFSRGKWLTAHRLLRGKHKRGRSGKPVKAWLHLMVKHTTPPLYRWLLRKRGGLEKAIWQRAALSPLKAEHIRRHRCVESMKHFTDHYQRHSVKAHHRRELFDVGVEGRLVESELCGRMFRIEYRYPMLDVPLVELAYNMPSHLKNHQGTERYMFRRVLEGVTTERIQWRVKADVSHPQIDHNNKHQSDKLAQQLRDSRLAQTYCDPSKLQHLTNHESAFFLLRNYQLLLDLEAQLDRGNVESIK